MAGVKIDSTDISSSYGFKVLRDGVTANPAPARRVNVTAPGIDGDKYINVEAGPRPITIRGVIQGTSQSDMYTKIFGLEAMLLGSFGSASATTPARAEFTITVPNFGSIKFGNCSYDGMEIEYVGPREIATVCIVTIRFIQSVPRITAVT